MITDGINPGTEYVEAIRNGWRRWTVSRTTPTQVIMTDDSRWSVLDDGTLSRRGKSSTTARPMTEQIALELAEQNSASDAWAIVGRLDTALRHAKTHERATMLRALRAAELRLRYNPAELSRVNTSTPRGTPVLVVDLALGLPITTGKLHHVGAMTRTAHVVHDHPSPEELALPERCVFVLPEGE